MVGAAVYAALGAGFAFLMTVLGSAAVLLFQKEVDDGFHRFSLGFASGVMGASAVWSLLLPAAQQAAALGWSVFFVLCCGVGLGVVSLFLLDLLASSFLRKGRLQSTSLLFFTITLHNIPEGMAVGLAFCAAIAENPTLFPASAAALAFGIGIQNLPEGTAVSLPLRKEGKSPFFSFFVGVLSGAAEPVAALAAVAFAPFLSVFLPFLMSFAAGAMFYAVAKELLPAAFAQKNFLHGGLGLATGFGLMMALDLLLG